MNQPPVYRLGEYMKIIILTICLLTSLSFTITPTLAEESTTTRESNSTTETKSAATATTKETTDASLAAKKKSEDALKAYREAKETDRLTKLQTLGSHLIDQRVAELKRFTSRTFKGLSTAETASIKTIAEKAITDLTALKAKIAAATTAEEAKTLVRSIYSDYHVYAVLVPSLHLTIATEQIEAAIAKLKEIAPRLAKAIDSSKTAGKDTATLEQSLGDFNAQIASATESVAAAKADIAKMDVKNLDISKTLRASARESLKKARASLVAARGDLKSLKDSLELISANSAVKKSTTSTESTSNATSSNSAATTETVPKASSTSGAKSNSKSTD